MIKKYQEFIFERTSDEFKIQNKGRQYEIKLNISDLNSDYEFHKNIMPYVDKAISSYENYQNHNKRTIFYIFEQDRKIMRKKITEYVWKTFKDNNLSCRTWGIYDMPLKVEFTGDKLNLENINRYFGIVDNKNIIALL